MATKKSDGMASSALVAPLLNAVQHGGKIHVNVCTYVADGTEVAGDIIELCRLPQGAKVLPHMSYINGDQADAKAEIVGYTAPAGVAINAYSGLAAVALNLDETPLTESTTLTAKLIAAGMTAGKKLVVGVVYAQL